MAEIQNGKEILYRENQYYLELILSRLINICQKKVKYYIDERKLDLILKNKNKSKIKSVKGKIKSKVITNKIQSFLYKRKLFNKDLIFNDKCYTTRNHNEDLLNSNTERNYFLTEIYLSFYSYLGKQMNNQKKKILINTIEEAHQNLEKIKKETCNNTLK